MKKKSAVILFSLLGLIGFALFFAYSQFQKARSITSAIETITQNQNSRSNGSILFDLQPVSDLIPAIESVSKSKLLLAFIPQPHKAVLQQLAVVSPDLKTVVHSLIAQPQKWLVIFQNSNELRATGGFMGSYAVIDINEGKIVSITTEDIYDADGQFSGYVAAPHGVAEYLSGGNGMRLPDANWHPDTPTSSQQILHFFALGNKKNIAGVVFINLEFAQELLTFIGPVQLSDYNTIVTAENIDAVLRSRRDEFFPGSTQKKHMLSQLLTQTRIALTSTPVSEFPKLLELLSTQLALHNVQLYAVDPQIDSIFHKWGFRQELTPQSDAEYVYLVESNVGINKANKGISRQARIQKADDSRVITIQFHNTNQKPSESKLTGLVEHSLLSEATDSAEQTATLSAVPKQVKHNAYINYQRILVPVTWQLESVLYQKKELPQIHESIVETESGISLKEIGFLVTLQEQETSELEISFSTTENHEQIFIQKQPGIPTTHYTLEYNTHVQTIELAQDSLVRYEK